jgi:hypothetical protein
MTKPYLKMYSYIYLWSIDASVIYYLLQRLFAWIIQYPYTTTDKN